MENTPTNIFTGPSQDLLEIIELKRASIRAEYEQNRGPYYEKLRAAGRAEYAARRAAEGHPPVRKYKFHSHVEPVAEIEDPEARVQRMNRDRKRAYRGVTESTVRAYQDLSGLTSIERAERKRTKARERQRARRAAILRTPPVT